MFKNSEIFESAPIPKAVAKLALPTMLTMLVNVLYNMVDTYFIGRTGDPNQVAAVSIATLVPTDTCVSSDRMRMQHACSRLVAA